MAHRRTAETKPARATAGRGEASGKPHEAVAVVENPMGLCLATNRSGGPCEKQAGWGTDHFGDGRCRLHGGNGGRPIVHGRYSLKHRPALEEKRERFLADPAPLSLEGEIALSRALLEEGLETYKGGDALKPDQVAELFGLIESVTRQVEKAAKILNQTALTQAEVRLFVARLGDLAVKYIPDADTRTQFFRELESAVGAR